MARIVIVMRISGAIEVPQEKVIDSGLSKRIQLLPLLVCITMIAITLDLAVTQHRLFYGKTFP